MAGCSVILLMPIFVGFGMVVAAFMLLKLAVDAVVGTIALPLLVVSIACGIAALVLVVRALWLRFHDHREIDLPHSLIAPAVLAIVATIAFCVALLVSGVAFYDLFSQELLTEATDAWIGAL